MPLFCWNKTYSVNNEELDNHHNILINIINRLYENCLDRNRSHCLDLITEELLLYSRYHFLAEEAHMTKKGFNEMDRHLAEHAAFTQRALQLRKGAGKDDFEASKELTVYLGHWLLHHVLEEDRKYST